jgi:hypothetical protein
MHMSNNTFLITAVIVMALSACSSNAPSSGQTEAKDSAANPDAATSKPAAVPVTKPASSGVAGDTPITKENYDKAEWKKISLVGYSCGDNCYVEYTPQTESGGDMTALCSAEICGEWERAQKLPAAFKGKTAEVKLGKATRADGGGNIVDEYDNITEIRFPK